MIKRINSLCHCLYNCRHNNRNKEQEWRCVLLLFLFIFGIPKRKKKINWKITFLKIMSSTVVMWCAFIVRFLYYRFSMEIVIYFKKFIKHKKKTSDWYFFIQLTWFTAVNEIRMLRLVFYFVSTSSTFHLLCFVCLFSILI